jgi:hypothetical protein
MPNGNGVSAGLQLRRVDHGTGTLYGFNPPFGLQLGGSFVTTTPAQSPPNSTIAFGGVESLAFAMGTPGGFSVLSTPLLETAQNL